MDEQIDDLIKSTGWAPRTQSHSGHVMNLNVHHQARLHILTEPAIRGSLSSIGWPLAKIQCQWMTAKTHRVIPLVVDRQHQRQTNGFDDTLNRHQKRPEYMEQDIRDIVISNNARNATDDQQKRLNLSRHSQYERQHKIFDPDGRRIDGSLRFVDGRWSRLSVP